MPPAAATAFPSTKETTNYARLCRPLVDVGSQALRDTFDAIHPPILLPAVLRRHPEHAILQSLKKKRLLNPTQWGKLYPTRPSSVSSENFDITLLMVLLRNICGLAPPSTGWDSLPPASDVTKEANIARLKYYRNIVYGHASKASVDDTTFDRFWQDISNAVVRLVGASYGAAIGKLKKECMDPDTEEHYRQLLEQWKQDEDNIKEKIREIEDRMTNNQNQMMSEMKDISETLKTVVAQLKERDRMTNDENQMMRRMKDIGETSETLIARQQETKEREQLQRRLHPTKHSPTYRRNTERNDTANPTIQTTTATIPYIKGMSENILHILQPFIRIRVAHKPITTLRQLLTNFKEKDEPRRAGSDV